MNIKSPIFDILYYIAENNGKIAQLSDKTVVDYVFSLAITACTHSVITERKLKDWSKKRYVSIYADRAQALADTFSQLNPKVEAVWFQRETLEEFKVNWEQLTPNFTSKFIYKPSLSYQLVRKAFDGGNRIIFELLQMHSEGNERLFHLYTPNADTPAEPIIFSGRDLDIGDNNVLYGSSRESKDQNARPRGLFLRHEVKDPTLNRHRFGLTVGSTPEYAEPVAAKFYCYQLDDHETAISPETLGLRVKYGNKQDIELMFPETADLICDFIENKITKRGVLSFVTQTWNDTFRNRLQ